MSPCSVAVDGDGNILVAVEYNHRIQKITGDGKFLTAVVLVVMVVVMDSSLTPGM